MQQDTASSFSYDPDLRSFLCRFPRYPQRSATLYAIYRDIKSNNDVEGIKILDIGDQYIISAMTRKTQKERIHVAVDYDDDVDLHWLQKYSSECEDDDRELCMCLVTTDTIIYQFIGTRLRL